ncbi:MAG: nucleotidyltransferase domain-containing protein [Elusimicrobia bacterium]|nr:nucleotidyltransferase domain-containing protein [Elusimicrobiota bacterium]
MTRKMKIREKEILNGVIQILKEEINPDKILLFGSRAKGTGLKNTDFDIAVDTEKPDIDKRREIEEKINEIAGLYKVDVVYLGSVDEDFRRIVLKTGRIIYERNN